MASQWGMSNLALKKWATSQKDARDQIATLESREHEIRQNILTIKMNIINYSGKQRQVTTMQNFDG